MLRCRRAVLSIPTSQPVRSFPSVAARQYATPVDGPIEGDGIVRESRPLVRRVRSVSIGTRLDALYLYNKQKDKGDRPKPQPQPQPPRNKSKPKPSKTHSTSTHGRACSVLTSAPHSTRLVDLLAQIPPLDSTKFNNTFGLFVFLVTPAYASDARRANELFEQTVLRLYPESNVAAHGIHTLVAVVDRLPQPSASAQDGGSEGVAFLFADEAIDAPGLFTEEVQDHNKAVVRDIASSLQIRRSLTFDMLSHQTYAGQRQSSSKSYSIQVPLANTIFQNGLPTTLIHTRYDRPDASSELIKVSARHLNNQSLRVPLFLADSEGSNLTLTAPLVPLTPARSVVACMGNIVRRLSANPRTPSKTPEDDTILASQELEESVQAYFKARDIPPQTVSVWALVVPKAAFSAYSNSMVDVLHPNNLSQRWKENALKWIESATHTPLSLLQHHARLHKVISGGGGWGKKAGLLSLDADSSYSPDETTSQESAFFAGLNLDREDQASALRDIVSPGDHIQFYISPTASATPTNYHSPPDLVSKSQSAVFGTVPSTIDNIPEAALAGSNSTATPTFYPDHFGALSEVGVALTINKHDHDNVEQLNQTKVDVPFGRFTLLTHGKSEDIASTGAGEGDGNLEHLWDRFQEPQEPSRDEEEKRVSSRLDFKPTKPLRS